jgi:hypothetical protein
LPTRTTHIAVGVPAGIAASVFSARSGNAGAILLEAVGGGLGGFAGAALPDVLEPPDNPNHRGIAHGIAPIGGLGFVVARDIERVQDFFRTEANQYAALQQTAVSPALCLCFQFLEALMRMLAGAVAGFVAGYTSHLILDLATPRSLPLIPR